MKRQGDVDEYRERAEARAIERGDSPHGRRVDEEVGLYEACVPAEFWGFTRERITYNLHAFETFVFPYCERWKAALEDGYGLLFIGPNGVGKTLALSWILRSVIRRGCSAYYTTAPQLDYDARTGWQDREVRLRLDEMLGSDFLAVDELNKDRVERGGGSLVRDHIERVLKRRFDDQLPTVLATNATMDDLRSHMGESFMSIVEGKYEVVAMDPGDFRKTMERDRRARMGFPGGDE